MRIVCATHQDLEGLIRDGGFREDLYYRLAEIVVEIPALREREGDSSLIAHALVKRFASENGRASMQLGDDAVAAIDAHPWPGNVRELENCIKRAVIMADGTRIGSGRSWFRHCRRGLVRAQPASGPRRGRTTGRDPMCWPG